MSVSNEINGWTIDQVIKEETKETNSLFDSFPSKSLFARLLETHLSSLSDYFMISITLIDIIEYMK